MSCLANSSMIVKKPLEISRKPAAFALSVKS
jgi:hypothetical protein